MFVQVTKPDGTSGMSSSNNEIKSSTPTESKERYYINTTSPPTIVVMKYDGDKNKQCNEEHDHELNNDGDKVIKITKCKSCEKLLEMQEDSISCDNCLENQISELLNDTTHNRMHSMGESSNITEAGHCCCSCHQDDPQNTTQGTDTITNVEINCDNASQVTITSVTSGNKSSANTANERICRICLDNIDQDMLIAPCKCSGSTKYAHEQCLLKWFFKSSKKSCEVCLGNVNVTPIGYKPVQQWRLPDRGCDFIVYLFGLYFLIMVIFTGMITWIATQGCTSPVCVTLYAVCGIALLYFFYCCGCVEYSRRYWRALLSVNRIWRIYGREDSVKNLKFSLTPKPKKEDAIVPIQTMGLENRDNIRPFVIEVDEHSPSINNNDACATHVIGLDNHAIELDDEVDAQNKVTTVTTIT